MARGLLGFTALVIVAFAVLAGLGVWQLQRLQWKEGLIAKIEARTKAPPIGLKDAAAMAAQGRDPSYYRVRASGRFDHAKERYLFALSEGRAGWHVITPLQTADGETVLIDRGFVPDSLKAPALRAEGEVEGVVTVTGIVRLPDTPRPLHARQRARGQSLVLARCRCHGAVDVCGGSRRVAPFFLEAEKGEVPGGWPEGGQTRLDLPNNHLQYAITWFLLAAALLGVYGAYVWKAKAGKRRLAQGEKG